MSRASTTLRPGSHGACVPAGGGSNLSDCWVGRRSQGDDDVIQGGGEVALPRAGWGGGGVGGKGGGGTMMDFKIVFEPRGRPEARGEAGSLAGFETKEVIQSMWILLFMLFYMYFWDFRFVMFGTLLAMSSARFVITSLG